MKTQSDFQLYAKARTNLAIVGQMVWRLLKPVKLNYHM
ncbi:unknown protein [Cronobacter turicensis z3032]|uniref:Uncharacterized protein n=1 Tax=Cronobacter turicensis (strain DSM 18703 / CCUG 55852 / LMG 23827 / z3032) TaxID=693216 RepID=C9Y2P3_CROTZ|nr:unknown protein [Cronobacter turicensis z3032]